jgi:ATP-dependent Clp protease ATP-binding subunit ClpA
LAPAFEIDEVLSQIDGLLSSGRHLILAGDSGVGKTAIVHELVRRSKLTPGEGPLAGRRVLQFSLQRRASGLRDTNQLRPELQRLVDALLAKGKKIVPFFRDLHLADTFDLEPQFHTMAFRLTGPILCEGRQQAVRAILEECPELEQQYVVVEVEEPNLQRTSRLLRAWRGHQEREHGRQYEPEALQHALQLSNRLSSRSGQPRKSIDLLGQAGSLVSPGQAVTAAHVLDRFCTNYKVPRRLVDPSVSLDLTELELYFASRILGQDEAVGAVVKMISLIKAGLCDARRPFGVFLFVGPTGVGKTHVAQLLAEYLFGDRERVIRFNMADYQADTAAGVLFGDPEEYRPPKLRGLLTCRLMGQPFGVLLLDEFEKANNLVIDRFLQLIDEGSFINAAGELVSCRSLIIIATCNVGAETYRLRELGFSARSDLKEKDREVDRRLEERFRFELLNRFDRVVHFHPLTREDIRIIAQHELQRLQERPGLQAGGLQLKIDTSVVDWLTANGFDPHFGARHLRRSIERHVVTAIAEAIVRAQPEQHATITLSVRQGRIVAGVTAVCASESLRVPHEVG